MSRTIFRWAAVAQICLILFTGCHPTQPFFVAKDHGLGEYLDQAMRIDYADVHVETLPEASQSRVPLGPSHVPEEFLELSLEDCISFAIQNSKILRVVNGSNQQSGAVAAALLSAGPGQMPSVYDPAITASTANTQPLTIDNNGNRVSNRGAIRANQVGGVADALSEFDAQFSALFGYNTTDRPRNVGPGNPFNPQFFQAVDSNGQAALSKRLATGGVATLRTTTVYSSNNIPAGGVGRFVPTDYTQAVEAQITHPLMRGRGTLVNRIPVVLAAINEDIQLHEFEANVTNLVKSVEDAYWDLYSGYQIFEANKQARNAALNLWQVASARLRADGAPEAEAQARALYQQFEYQLHVALNGSTAPGNDPNGLFGKEQILREKLGLGATDNRMIRPSDKPTLARIEFDWFDVTAEGLVRNIHLRREKWGIKQRELELISAKNQILPQVDVTAFYRWVGVGDQWAAQDRSGVRFPGAGSNAFESLTSGDYQEAGARIEFTPPAFGMRKQLANIQNSQIQIAKSHEELKDKEILLVHLLSTAWRNMESTFMSMKQLLDQMQANEDEIKIYNDKIKGSVGELSQLLDNLLRAEQRRAQATIQYHQTVSEYNKSIVYLHYLKGSLLDLNSINLQEGQWVDKAYWDAAERAREREAGHYIDYGYTRPAVVSAGPVERGMPTQGSFAKPGVDQLPVPLPTEPEGEGDDGGSSDEKKEDLDAPKTPGEKRPVASFDWGNFGAGSLAANQPTSNTTPGNPTRERGNIGNPPLERGPSSQPGTSVRVADYQQPSTTSNKAGQLKSNTPTHISHPSNSSAAWQPRVQ
jgi:outer membrane protein TolC